MLTLLTERLPPLWPSPSTPILRRDWWLYNALLALLYYGCARLGLALQFEQTQASPVWPPSGLAISAMLLLGARAAPGVFVGAAAANLADFYVKSTANSLMGYLFAHPEAGLMSLFIGAGNAGEAVVVALLVVRTGLRETLFQTPRSVWRFIIATTLGCLVSATVGVSTLALGGALPPTLYPTVWFTWWWGDASGALILTPLLYNAARPTDPPPRPGWEEGLTLTLLVLLAGTCFLQWFALPFFFRQAYFLLPVLLVCCFRYSSRLTNLAVVIVSGMAILGTIKGKGPFAITEANVSLLLLQGYVSVIAVTVQCLQASLMERTRALEGLEESNRKLQAQTQVLEKTNRELERSNSDLYDFAYIASHDLKEPLRGIDHQVTFLLEDHGSTLPPAALARLHRLHTLAQRLENLVDTLLHYSRLGRAEQAIANVDLERTLHEVCATLGERLAGVELRQPRPLPTLRCDSTCIAEVFQNLLANAAKYNDKAQRWVEVGYLGDQGEGHHFYVSDNGIGIPERHLERVFHIFKRLHADNEYGGGNGAGLTIVKKIVERHDGRIWVESKEGQGSAFHFTLGRL